IDVPTGYTSSTSELANGKITITNTHEPEMTEVVVNKVWEDKDNQDGVRPTSVTVNLLANGVEIDEVNRNESNSWTHTFDNLPVNNNGEEISYTITEDEVENYSTVIEGSTVKNIYTPDERTVTVTKSWDDNDDQDGIRPETVT